MTLLVRQLGLQNYQTSLQAMQRFTQARTPNDQDECWVVQHPAVYTLGQAAKTEHILNTKQIPVVQSDRGGQVTYHAPGQWLFYLLINLKRKQLGVRQFVTCMEQSVVDMLSQYNVVASALADAPGVYVEAAKIAALGLRIKRGYSYHGISLNVDMDLSPFSGINPCGFKGLAVVNTTQLNSDLTQITTKTAMLQAIQAQFNYTSMVENNSLPEAWHEQ